VSDIQPVTPSDVDEILDSAVEAYEVGRLDNAEDSCRELVALDPENVLALHLLGIIAGKATK
jgi:predicted Zn-dependent protease